MAGADGQAPDAVAPPPAATPAGAAPAAEPSPAQALLAELARAPYDFDLFQALRRLECVYAERPRFGESARVADDPVRLAQQPSCTFAPTTLAALRPGRDGRAPRLEIYAYGLFGPNGPLPLHLTEYARDRARNNADPTFARFADIFHHRMMSLLYRAWADAEPTVSLDRPARDRFATYTGALCGYGMPGLRERDTLGHRPRLHFAGLLAAPARHPDGLCAILADYFRLPVRIEEYVGHWLELPEESRCRLGESRASGTLGMNACIGARVWDRQYKFRIVMGPLTLADYERLLPGGDGLDCLRAWVQSYVGDEFAWDVNLILAREEVPRLALGGTGRLGWTSWLGGTRARTDDPRDLRLQPPPRRENAVPVD